MDKTKIDWCDSTWNPVTGCYHSCEYCYARGMAHRFGAGWETSSGKLPVLDRVAISTRGKEPYPYNFIPTFHRYRLDEYINKKGRNIFVCSMADLFGSWVSDEWIEEVFDACRKAPQHNYLFLTKDPARYAILSVKGKLPKGDNMWYGFSATSSKYVGYWNNEYNTFASVEPLLEPMEAPFAKWVIIGAETGKRKGKVVPDRKWIEDIVEGCRENDTPVFMKSSLSEIWGEPLIQEFPSQLLR